MFYILFAGWCKVSLTIYPIRVVFLSSVSKISSINMLQHLPSVFVRLFQFAFKFTFLLILLISVSCRHETAIYGSL